MRDAWTIHLHRPTSYFKTGDRDALEITVYRPGMLRPLEMPCEGHRLKSAADSYYLLELVLNVFVKEENRNALLKLHTDNMDCLRPTGRRADMKASDEQCSREMATFTPVGMHPSAMYGWHKDKVYQEGEKPAGTIYRPGQIFDRDIVILHLLKKQATLLGLQLDCLLFDNSESGYLAKDGKSSRKDVTYCAYTECFSLSGSHSRCSACRSAYYCCPEHQKKDWPVHKAICRSTRALFEEMKQQQELIRNLGFADVGKVPLFG